MRYYKVTAGYRPKNKNKPTYVFGVPDSITPRKMKTLFNTMYSWLDVYDVEEIYEATPFTLYFDENKLTHAEVCDDILKERVNYAKTRNGR